MNAAAALQSLQGIVHAAVDGRELAVSALLGDVYHALTMDELLHFRASVSGESLVLDIIGPDAEPTRSKTLVLRRMTANAFIADVTKFIEEALIFEMLDGLEADLDQPGDDTDPSDDSWEEIT